MTNLGKVLFACVLMASASSVSAQDAVEPNSQYYVVKNYFVPTASGDWTEYRAALFAQPKAAGVTPMLWLLPRVSIDPASITYYDENGIPFSASVGTGKVANSINIPLKYDAALPNPAQAIGIGAALDGASAPPLRQPWLVGPDMPYISPVAQMVPGVGNLVMNAYLAMKPQFAAFDGYARTYQGYKAQNATLKEVVVTLAVNGDVLARRDFKGSYVSFDDTMPSLVVVNPTLQQQNLIAQGLFDVNVGFRFLDAQTKSLEARYDLSAVMDQFLEETQKATTKSSSSGWQVLGFGNRRSRLKTSLDQHVDFKNGVTSMAQTRMVTYDATDDMIDTFESHFFPTLSKEDLVKRHLDAAAEARASNNEKLAALHEDYAKAIQAGDVMKEVDIDKAVAALGKKDYVGFVAHGMRFSQSDNSRTDNYRRVISVQQAVEEHREWTDYRTRTVQRETTIPVAIEKPRTWKASLGLCNLANMSVPIARPYYPTQLQQVNVLTCVDQGGPMQRAGFEPGMLVTEFDGQTISTVADIDSLAVQHKPGDQILVEYIDLMKSNQFETAFDSKWVTMGQRP